MKKIIYFFAAAIVSIFPLSANANFIITEVVYDLEGTDGGREWIEVQNIGTEPLDLSLWKLFEADVNHKISAIGESLVPPQGFAVIADDPTKFKTDNSTYSGILFDSAFSLSNTGETLILRNQELVDIDSYAYSSSQGALGDGHSLQKSAGSWIAAVPTPGSAANETSSVPASSTPQSEEGYSSHSNQEKAASYYSPPELEVSAGRERLGYTGVPLQFEAKVRSSKNISASDAISSVWSMGDGNKISGRFISHAYDFPGEYIVILNSQGGQASAVAKTKVKVIEPRLRVKSAGPDFIEIENLDHRELNLGGFALESGVRRFIVPADTIIAPNSSVKIPSSVTNLRDIDGEVSVRDARGRKWGFLGSPGGSALQTAALPMISLPWAMDEKELLERFKRALER